MIQVGRPINIENIFHPNPIISTMLSMLGKMKSITLFCDLFTLFIVRVTISLTNTDRPLWKRHVAFISRVGQVQSSVHLYWTGSNLDLPFPFLVFKVKYIAYCIAIDFTNMLTRYLFLKRTL